MSASRTREGTLADAIDGIVPRRVVTPETADEVAETLASASRERRATVLRGGGTKLGWGRVPSGVDVVLDTTRLDRLLAHQHGDLTVTTQAGMPLAALNARLAERGQCLPVESAFDRTTVGGLLATNESGPLRHRFLTPRDLLIGVTLATTAGRLVKAGGTVVKNVAGYDLGKLVSGSHGTLAAIVEATFKLLPIPRASATLVADYANAETLAADVARLNASQVEPVAFDLRVSEQTGLQLLLRVASSPEATEAQTEDAKQALSGRVTSLTGEAERALWLEQIRVPWFGRGAVLRFSWLPNDLLRVLERVQRLQREGCGPVTFTGRVTGAGLLRLDGNEQAAMAVVADLRAYVDVGHVVVLRASSELKQHVDVWGPESGAARMARALKEMFDPEGILNAGRGPL